MRTCTILLSRTLCCIFKKKTETKTAGVVSHIQQLLAVRGLPYLGVGQAGVQRLGV